MSLRNVKVLPLRRLGQWDGVAFVPIGSHSVVAPRVHVITHGWARGLGKAVAQTDGFLRVWDGAAVTDSGSRFDRWFAPLARAIVADDPEATVLAFTWIDDSATSQSAVTSLRSQLRTTVNGQRLAAALKQALAEEDQQVHLIGFSHGAKVATVAAVLLDPLPDHLTILDSPDSLVPILGGALNDLSSYLRVVAPGGERDDTFVDNYRSHFGIPYGTRHGLGSIVDVTLDPDIAIVPEPPSGHAYAWAWYLHTAQNPELGVGYAWSPLRPTPSVPGAAQLRQAGSADADPFRLEHDQDTEPGVVGAKTRTRTRRKRDRTTVLSTSGKTHTYGLFWRRSGDLWASAPVEWSHGPDTATLSVYTNLTERVRSMLGSSPDRNRVIYIPLGGARLGPMLIKVELDSDAPAEVKFSNARAVHGFVLPTGSEAQAWLRPAVLGATFVAITFAGWALKRVMRTGP